MSEPTPLPGDVQCPNTPFMIGVVQNAKTGDLMVQIITFGQTAPDHPPFSVYSFLGPREVHGMIELLKSFLSIVDPMSGDGSKTLN